MVEVINKDEVVITDGNGLLTQTNDNGTESVYHVSLAKPFAIPSKPRYFDSYIVDAKRILDAESKGLNPEGIERLVAALIIEVRGNNNFGKHN